MTKTPEVGYFLDDEEAELVSLVESGTLSASTGMTPEQRAEILSLARATIGVEQESISLSISKTDLLRLKAKAMREGVPYQALISSILQKYLAE